MSFANCVCRKDLSSFSPLRRLAAVLSAARDKNGRIYNCFETYFHRVLPPRREVSVYRTEAFNKRKSRKERMTESQCYQFVVVVVLLFLLLLLLRLSMIRITTVLAAAINQCRVLTIESARVKKRHLTNGWKSIFLAPEENNRR